MAQAFNRWLDEDWGFHYRERIFAAPYLSLAVVDEAVAELEWALERAPTSSASVRPRSTRRRARSRRRTRPSTASGAWSMRPASRSWSTPATAATAPTATRGGLQRLVQHHVDRPVPADDQVVQHRAGGVRVPHHHRLRQALRPLPERAHRLGGERLRVPGDLFNKLRSTAKKTPATSRGPGRDLPPSRLDQPLLGGRRARGGRADGRRPGDLRLGLAHIEGMPAPSTTPSS